MRKKIHPAIIFSLFTIVIAILIFNKPAYEDHSVKSKSNTVQVENQALHNLDKPIIDISGWQRPEEINYDILSQNISDKTIASTLPSYPPTCTIYQTFAISFRMAWRK